MCIRDRQFDGGPDVRAAIVHIQRQHGTAQHHAVLAAAFPEGTADEATNILNGVLGAFLQLAVFLHGFGGADGDADFLTQLLPGNLPVDVYKRQSRDNAGDLFVFVICILVIEEELVRFAVDDDPPLASGSVNCLLYTSQRKGDNKTIFNFAREGIPAFTFCSRLSYPHKDTLHREPIQPSERGAAAGADHRLHRYAPFSRYIPESSDSGYCTAHLIDPIVQDFSE